MLHLQSNILSRELMDCIQRVDQMIRQNNITCAEAKKKQAYRRQLQKYQRQKHKEALRSYSQVIKQGNKKALLKLKAKNKPAKKKNLPRGDPTITFENNGQNKSRTFNSSELKRVSSAIQARAERILQQKQLHRLEQCLAQQKRKTKLHQLNNRCRKLVEKNLKTSTGTCVPLVNKQILSQLEKNTMEQIGQLDEIIGGILAGRGKATDQSDIKLSLPKKCFEAQHLTKNSTQKGHSQYQNFGKQEQNERFMEIFKLPVFAKSTEELLSLEYIPI